MNMDNSATVTAFHGSGKLFKKFEQKYARIPNDFMGGGIAYFTTDLGVAKTYARSMAKTAGTGTEYVYTVTLSMQNVFDVNKTFYGEELVALLPRTPDELERFARGAGILKYGVDRTKVLMDLKAGKISMSGERLFKGLSHGGVDTAIARSALIAHGYDALRYNGGANMDMAVKHDVYIPYNANGISIQKIAKIVRKPKVAA